ncbi:GNS1/SUR4 family protein [Colletotrichum higginsianum]|uniref:Elongation of fatty acids protein n=1 Tax=Colletotrichum higginsianum (strain IMI 349063) TaxID=759273 RepID=H1V258_COLHI|nr:Elongation of fatty acids protein [Colletotrichum higginsianum IMI 349063]OBR10352.1 Elongation of fatty acids protein [Colletotrichum higginsianum IMI 349063]CCF34310.1 GNS1/SUR4 family protein [Colletotrichum higginsianum]
MFYENYTSNHTFSPLNAGRETPSSLFSPWKTFDKVFTSVMGYPTKDFEFVPGHTPFSTFSGTMAMVVLYLVVIFGGREVMRNRKPLELNALFKIHNLFLSLLSGALLVLFVEQIVPSLWRGGLYENICGQSGWTQPLVLLYYVSFQTESLEKTEAHPEMQINYLTKYYELIDTVFLMVKKKPLTFLHCYHHPATALLCFSQLIGGTPLSWVPITLNLTVHVVMYWYYFQTARGVKVWWKQWITRLQIAQFVLDLGFVYFGFYDVFADTYFKEFLPHVGRCGGEFFAAVTGGAILTSYLVLFIMFYISTYKKAGRRAAQKLKSTIASEKSSLAAATAVANNATAELET